MAGYVVEALECPIDSGGAEVQFEVVKTPGGGVHADLNITAPLDDLELSYDEVLAIHNLTANVLAVMKEARA